MNPDLPEPAPFPNLVPHTSFWSAHRRRPAFLLILIVGLASFFFWMSGGTRAMLWAAFAAQRVLVILLCLFVLLTLSLILSTGQRLDIKIFRFLNTRDYPAWLDHFMWFTTHLGNMLAAMIAALLFFVLTENRLAMEIIFGTLTLWLFVEIIKTLTDRERPFLSLELTRVIGWQEKGDSFPSGHTSQMFFVVMLFIQHFQPGMAVTTILIILAVLVGFTRIYVGAHYPRDVLAGMVLGSVWGLLITMVDPYWHVLGF
jgi:membrane-associated phospholipid phosphatase